MPRVLKLVLVFVVGVVTLELEVSGLLPTDAPIEIPLGAMAVAAVLAYRWRGLRAFLERDKLSATLCGVLFANGALILHLGPYVVVDPARTPQVDVGFSHRLLPVRGYARAFADFFTGGSPEARDILAGIKDTPWYARYDLPVCKAPDRDLDLDDFRDCKDKYGAKLITIGRGTKMVFDDVRDFSHGLSYLVRGKLRLGGQDQRVAFSAGREKIESLLFKELLSPKPFDVLLAAQPPPIARAIRARKVLGTMNARQIKMALGRPRRVLTPKKSAWGQPVLLLEYGTHRSEIGDQVLEPGPNFVLDRAGEAILARFGDEEYARAKELRSALFDAYRRYPVVSLDFARKALRLHVWWVNEREVSAERVGAVRAELLRRAKKRYKGRMERFDVTFSRVIPPGGHR